MKVMNKKRYISPSIKCYETEAICEGDLNNATVYSNNGQTTDSTFPIHNDEETPDGTKDYYNNVNNWGGD